MSRYQPSSQTNGHAAHSPSTNAPNEPSVAGPSSGGEDYTKCVSFSSFHFFDLFRFYLLFLSLISVVCYCETLCSSFECCLACSFDDLESRILGHTTNRSWTTCTMQASRWGFVASRTVFTPQSHHCLLGVCRHLGRMCMYLLYCFYTLQHSRP